MGGELQDNTEARAFTPADTGYSQLTVSNAEMAAFQGSQSGSVSVVDREQTMFATGFDFAQAENIYGKDGSDLLAYKPNQSDASDKIQIADKPHEKLIPKDGQTITLKQLLNDYQTPFMDAYERSKHLKDGDPGKSKALEDVVDRLKDCPWADQIRIKFDSKADNTEYRNTDSTIIIRPQDPPDKQIENFAHEGYHATHQFLSKLYDHGKLSKQDFVNTWLQGEVNSMLTEVKVFHELGLTGEPPKFHYIRSDGKPDSIDVEQYAKEHGEQGLREFLRTNQPKGHNAVPYGQHYANFYGSYISNFDRNKPAVEQYIKQWVQSGRARGDI